jgi:hypothetical protein
MHGLQQLILARMGLRGSIPDGIEAAKDAALPSLQVVDMSHNPLTGTLPAIWAGLTDLRAINISSTGIKGSLPASYASLQQLQEFRAADCPDINGTLPPEWALLKSLEVLEVTNSKLAGQLPAAYSGGEEAVKAGTAALVAASAVAAKANAAVATARRVAMRKASRKHMQKVVPSATSKQAIAPRYAETTVKQTTVQQLKVSAGLANKAVSALQAAMQPASAEELYLKRLREFRLRGKCINGAQMVPFPKPTLPWSLWKCWTSPVSESPLPTCLHTLGSIAARPNLGLIYVKASSSTFVKASAGSYRQRWATWRNFK